MSRFNFKSAFLIALFVSFITVLVGCAKLGATDTQQTEDGKPVTVTFYSYNSTFSNDYFQRFIADPVKKKFPNVTLNYVQGQLTGANSPDNLVAAGQAPDIVITGPLSLPVFRNLGMTQSLDPLVKKYKMDLKRFQPLLLDSIKQYDNGSLDAIPFGSNFAALYYNKDLFDKFGVAYPKENMTWDEVLNLAKKFNNTDGDNQYVGIIPPNPNVFGNQLSLPLVDASNHALVNTAKWAEIYELEQQFYALPGVVQSGGQVPDPLNSFIKTRISAMVADWADSEITSLEQLLQSGNSFNWDMTTYPSLPEKPGQSRNVSFKLLIITKASPHPDLDFQIAQLLTSDEEQTAITQNSLLMTVLDNPTIQNSYGANLPVLKGKNIAAALKSKPAPISNPTDYDRIVSTQINAGIQPVVGGKLDINSALIQAQDAADKAIAVTLQTNK